MIPVDLSREAMADIDRIIAHLGRSSGRIAIRVLDGVEQLIDVLGIEPESGMHVRVERPDLPTVRWTRLPGCLQYLAIYRYEQGRIEIIRVVHGRMDWLALLAPDP